MWPAVAVGFKSSQKWINLLPFAQLKAISSRNQGFITRSEALKAGFSDHKIISLIASGVLVRQSAGVYTLAGTPHTWRHQVIGAQIRAGDSSVVSHRSASMLWQFARFRSSAIDITSPWPAKRVRLSQALPGTVEHHISRDLRPEHCSVLDGIPVTDPTRTLVDMGARVGVQKLGFMIDDAVARNLTTYVAIHDLVVELSTPGRRGLVTVRKVLEHRPSGGEMPRSVLEAAVLVEILRAGLPEPERQFPVNCDGRVFHLDLAWPEVRVGVECDGFQFHRTPADLGRDTARTNALALRGWVIHRVTWQMIRQDPIGVIEEILRLIRLRQS